MSQRRMFWWLSIVPLGGLYALLDHLGASLSQWFLAAVLLALYGAMCKLEGEAK